jgi:F-type H+-transporting ATPase subunit gamma
MPTIIDIKEHIKSITALSELINAYEEIASIRMKKIRDLVLRNRQYQEDVNSIFERVRKSYSREVNALAKNRGKAEQITFIPHNGKNVAVLISANTGLYGNIIPDTYRMFLKEARESQSEVTIIGKYGFQLYLTENIGKPYTYFEYPDYGEDKDKLYEIIKHIVQYEQIHVFYGKFRNIISQEPTMLSVSAKLELTSDEGKLEKKEMYIFEPTLEKILEYFETQIFSSLFQQSLKESQLSKYASRFVAMDKASSNTENEMKKLEFEKNKVIHNNLNKKQLNTISGLVGAKINTSYI